MSHDRRLRRIISTTALVSACALVLPTSAVAIAPDQIMAAGVVGFSDAPSPAFGTSANAAIDWTERALTFDEFAYDWTDRGAYSTILVDETAHNMPEGEITFKMPAYYGDDRVQKLGENNGDGYQESVTQFSSILSATLAGIDKSNQECNIPVPGQTTCNYVDMLQTYFHQDIGVAGNTPILGAAGDGKQLPGTVDGWYQFLPNVLYYMVGEHYPDATNMDTMLRRIADNYYDMVVDIGGPNADFEMQDYNFVTKQKHMTTRDQTTDIGAATAAVLLWAHEKFGDAKYLTGAKWTMDALDRSTKNTYYEMIPLLLPYIGARMNALYGTDYDVDKHFRWLMSDSQSRNGWGTIGGKNRYDAGISTWGGKQVAGLSGSLTDNGFDGDSSTTGYGFAMNSFATTWLAATAKYDTQYADTVGKWLLNVNNASRWFFADQMTANQQQYGTDFTDGVSTGQPGSSAGWDTDDRAAAIAYEGLQPHASRGIYATADIPTRSGNWGHGPEARGLGLYGSGWIGFMSVIKPTNVPNVLKTDLNALDSYGNNDYPTSLLYNPTAAVANVQYAVSGATDLYDAVTGEYIAKSATGTTTVPVPTTGSVVVVELPAGASLVADGSTVLANGSPIAYDMNPQRDLALDGEASAIPADATAAAVNDGDQATAWSADSSVARSVTVDLGAVHEIGSAEVAWGKDFPDTYTVATSLNGTSWVGAQTVTSHGGIETSRFVARDAKYVRVTIPAGAGAFQLRSLSTRAANVARAKPVAVSGFNTVANPASALTDGSDQTRWESRTLTDQWATIDLGESQSIGTVKISWEGAYGKAYRLEVSDDNETWTTAYHRTGGTGGDETLSIPSGTTGRYLKWVGEERGTQYAYSMWSLEVNAEPGLSREGDIFVDEISAAPGASVPLSGRGYEPGESITITWEGGSTTTTANSDGAFDVEIAAPEQPGDYVFTVVGASSGVTRTAGFIVVSEPDPAANTTVALSIAPQSLVADATPGAVATATVTTDAAAVPQGTVRLVSGGSQIAVQTLASGAATFTIPSSLPVGANSITAVYESADQDIWLGSESAASTLTVVPAPVFISVTAKATPVGSATTATVTVSSAGKWTGGTVTLRGWGNTVQTVNVPASGRANVVLPRLKKAGPRTIRANFAGGTRLVAAESSINVAVGKAGVKVNVKAPKRAKAGKRVRIRITVKRPAGVASKSKAVIRVAGKKVKTIKVKKNGKATTRVKLNRTGKTKIRVNYKATKNLKKAKRVVTVRVR